MQYTVAADRHLRVCVMMKGARGLIFTSAPLRTLCERMFRRGLVIHEARVCVCACAFTGEESLMIFVDKRKLSRTSEVTESNGTAVTLEALHQLAASYFIDRESTLRKLHHIQIASTAIKVNAFVSLLSNSLRLYCIYY